MMFNFKSSQGNPNLKNNQLSYKRLKIASVEKNIGKNITMSSLEEDLATLTKF